MNSISTLFLLEQMQIRDIMEIIKMHFSRFLMSLMESLTFH